MEIYRFETARFIISLRAEPEDYPPEDSFQFPEDIAFARSGDPAAWFCAVCTVTEKGSGAVIGRDVLGGCSYRSFEDFVGSHRDPDPMHRNCSIMRAARGENVVMCDYFPGMIAEAVKDARATITRLCKHAA